MISLFLFDKCSYEEAKKAECGSLQRQLSIVFVFVLPFLFGKNGGMKV
jgi:hypothetical protein